MVGTLFFLYNCGGGENTDYSNVGVGVSKRTTAFLKGEKLDLSSELDPSQVPEIVKLSYLEGIELKKKGKELVKFVIQDISQKIAAISSIDLNNDKTPDPILIIPEGTKESMTFSIRVPDPGKVKKYPNSADEWQAIAENRAIEVLSVTVFPRNVNGKANMDIEARPHPQAYETHHHHHYQSSFFHSLLTYHMMSSLFFSPFGWYGPGFYGGMGYWSPGYYQSNYSNRNVSTTRQTRKQYRKSPSSTKAMRTNSGKTVRSSMHSTKNQSLNRYKSSAIQKRKSVVAKKATGFGRSKPRSSQRSSGWGRSYRRSSGGGWGSRGFGK